MLQELSDPELGLFAVEVDEESEDGGVDSRLGRVLLLKHQLQVAVLSATAHIAEPSESAASPSDVSWVHEQLMTRDYMAKIICAWGASGRRLVESQIQALQRVASTIEEIEGLIAALPCGQESRCRVLSRLQCSDAIEPG